ncbi:MAG: dinitrogenase iron-molybdenum cofactor biosynthesis protein [Candidatus Omnitrophica bacterium]|nr:dinitrogenase iron-molybdenum cofactor biosynthesis protein [Candidatus Omnitrophota bacterium]
MRIGITLEDERGFESNVSQHFGQCRYFFIVNIEDKKIMETKVVPNNAQHGGGGCQAVDEILRHKVTHVIAGGMGGGAQQKFLQAGVKVFGYSGKVLDAVRDFLKGPLGGLDACREHGHDGECH